MKPAWSNGNYTFSERQVNAILDLRLYQLTGLERDSIKSEYDALIATIKDLLDILAREKRVLTIIKDELREIQKKYGNPAPHRRSPPRWARSRMEDLIANEGTIITITHNGFLKRTAVSSYRAQRRGGKGVIGMQTREGQTEEDNDFVEHLFTATAHDYLMFFTAGRPLLRRARLRDPRDEPRLQRPLASPISSSSSPAKRSPPPSASKARQTDEETWDAKKNIVFATKSGIVKKSNLERFKNIRKGGLIAIQIEEGDKLIEANSPKAKTRSSSSPTKACRSASTKTSSATRAATPSASGASGRSRATSSSPPPSSPKNARSSSPVENGIGKRTPFDEYRKQCARRQRHHHHEDWRQNRRRRRRPHRPGDRRAHAHHEQRPDDPHPRLAKSAKPAATPWA